MAKRSSIPAGPLTQERLHSLLHYDPLTGLFTNKVARSNSPVGAVVGSKNKVLGYIVVVLDYQHYYGHRLAWFYVYGVWPDPEVDHENRVRHDNRLENLRPATKGQQQQNAHRPNSTGYRGVYHRKGGRFVARITRDGKLVRLGEYATAAEAGQAYAAAKATMHPFQPTIPVEA